MKMFKNSFWGILKKGYWDSENTDEVFEPNLLKNIHIHLNIIFKQKAIPNIGKKRGFLKSSNGMNLRKILFLKFVPLLLCLSY